MNEKEIRATAPENKPLRLGDLPTVKRNILENAREYDKGVVGGYNGTFPLSAATAGGIYLLPSTGKFYVCETAYNGTQISAPTDNFVELSVWKNHDRLSKLSTKEEILFDGTVNQGQEIIISNLLKFKYLAIKGRFYPAGIITISYNGRFQALHYSVDADSFAVINLMKNENIITVESLKTGNSAIGESNIMTILGIV